MIQSPERSMIKAPERSMIEASERSMIQSLERSMIQAHERSIGLVREVSWATFVFETRKVRVSVLKKRVFPYMEDVNFDIDSSILAFMEDLTWNNKLNWPRHTRDHQLESN